MRDEEMTPEEFDAAFSAGEPVVVVGNAKVVLEGSPMPGALLMRATDCTFSVTKVSHPSIGRDYSPVMRGADVSSRSTAVPA